MSQILCEWLNRDVKLSRRIVPGSFPEAFSTGYLLGELLHKYGLQDDFKQFSQNRGADAKINNFSRLEPTLHLLGVQFNENMAQDIMTRQHGAATKLLYELYIALEKKRKTTLTGVTVGAMRPAATAKHMSTESGSQEQRYLGRRQSEIMARIQTGVIQIQKQPSRPTIKSLEDKRLLKKKREAENVYKEIEKFEKSMTGNVSAIHVHVTDSDMQELLQTQKFQEASLETITETRTELLSIYSDDEYLRKIQKHVQEDAFAREQRAKRRRKMLMDQLAAHDAQEKVYREEQLIYRLIKQSQHERRIATQLMHVRHEKEVIRLNRIFREKQYEERRQKEFQEALDREAALAKQEAIDNEEKITREKEHHEKIAAERAQACYKKHYSMCWEMIGQIIDISTKVVEYQQLTNNRVPLKLMLDWKELFFNGKPIYEQASIQPLSDEPSPEQLVELSKMSLLDEKDYGEYKSMTGEWSPTEENSENKPPLNNNILGHVLRRLMEMFYPPKPKSSREFPSFPVKGCILGKIFSGKTTCAKFIEKVCNIQVLSVGTLVQEAIEAFHNNEMKSESSIISQEAESSGEQDDAQESLPNSSPNLPEELQTEPTTELTTEPVLDNYPVEKDPSLEESQEEFESDKSQGGQSRDEEFESDNSQDDQSKLSVRAQLGAASQKWLKNGESVPDELLVDILLEAITQIPPEKGWIVEGFPMTINQAKLFEKSYTGIDVEAKDPISEKLSLAIDPRAPNQPPPTSPAFDVSILLDISDSLVLKRAANVKLDERKTSQGEQSSNQNSDAEILEENIGLAREQVLHRISGFLKTWPKLEKWFSVRQNNLVKVNAETEESLVCETVKEIITEEIVKNQNRRSAEEIPPEEEEVLPATDEEEVLPVAEEEEALPVKDQPSPSSEAPPVIEPGSDEWIYVDEPLPQEIIDLLVPYWEMVENTYMNTIKTVLRCLRDEQYTIIHYAADIRKNFQGYLRRPHFMQEFVSQWQADFNSIADELQDDEETKAELHQRVTDLRDLLWDICNSRREEAERERTGIMNEEWLPDRRGIAMNHFFTLMQVELDRFQDTKRLLHDYYRAMEGKIPTEDNQDFTRLPLLDIINGQRKEDQDESRRIPLVSLKLPPPGNTESEKSGTKKKSLKDNSSENRVTTCRDDKNLVIDTWRTAVTAVSDMVTAEIEFREMEEENERQLKQKSSKAAPKQPGKASGKDSKIAKNASSKSPPKKKGAKATPAPIDPEELRKEELAVKIKQEYFSALKQEEAATKSRLELIKEKALVFLEDLKFKAEEAYKDMEKWLGSTFLEEKSSVEKLVEVARHHIESSSKILYEMTLEGTDFFINSDVKMVPDPVPDPDPPPEFQRIETSGRSTLTISQLTTLHKQFLQLAPKGFISKKVFIETVSGLVNLNLGKYCYPDAWKNLTFADLENLASEFTVNSQLTDWRRFLLAAAQPWPVPSVTQLLQTLHVFKSVDVTGSGFVTQEHYLQVGLWFNGNEDLSITESCEEPVSLERLKHLIEFFFHLFADSKKDPALLDYIEMLLYFASHSDPVEGVYRALSIVTGAYIHRKKKASLPRVDSSSPNIMSNEKTLIKDEKEVLNYTGEGIISVASLLKVFHSRGSKDEDYHRFSCLEKADSYDKHFIKVVQELGAEDLAPMCIELLLKHPFMEDLINTCQEYKLPDIKVFLQGSKETLSTVGEQNTCEDINV
ncbi:LOW QUALITY PROTEIN: sperm flagellar protein 2 [Serinus canaria]|uniref:LOW QUALITY PROTEIN: sperm flagellar protein 2 n=1 Tax=Serinus canaria TaxID=9135 RepID=UPI0021CC90EE|nr:LOW QUALITY PROTEIN: sperm flagellar protein 2 [Serinus canaria]